MNNNNDHTVTLWCAFCGESANIVAPMPTGCATRYGGMDDEHAFCPKHAAVEPFFDSQCPGCVSGWGECGLYRAFAHKENTLTDADKATLSRGVCPKRVNGTLFVTNTADGVKVEDADIRSDPVAEAGAAVVAAIADHDAKHREAR